MNDTCYFTLDMKKLDPTPPNPRRDIACACVASSHERQHLPSLFLIENTPPSESATDPEEIVVFSRVKCAWPSFRL